MMRQLKLYLDWPWYITACSQNSWPGKSQLVKLKPHSSAGHPPANSKKHGRRHLTCPLNHCINGANVSALPPVETITVEERSSCMPILASLPTRQLRRHAVTVSRQFIVCYERRNPRTWDEDDNCTMIVAQFRHGRGKPSYC